MYIIYIRNSLLFSHTMKIIQHNSLFLNLRDYLSLERQ